MRASGLPYCVVRPTGLIQSDERPEDKEPYTVEFSQARLHAQYFSILLR